jgi:hypothetical protein
MSLLRKEDIKLFLMKKYPHMYQGNDEAWCRMKEDNLMLQLDNYNTELLLEAQHAKDQEEIKELKEQVGYMHEAYEVMCEVLETDCQKRIERIFEEIETELHQYHLASGKEIAQSFWWQALKSKYLAKIKEE